VFGKEGRGAGSLPTGSCPQAARGVREAAGTASIWLRFGATCSALLAMLVPVPAFVDLLRGETGQLQTGECPVRDEYSAELLRRYSVKHCKGRKCCYSLHAPTP